MAFVLAKLDGGTRICSGATVGCELKGSGPALLGWKTQQAMSMIKDLTKGEVQMFEKKGKTRMYVCAATGLLVVNIGGFRDIPDTCPAGDLTACMARSCSPSPLPDLPPVAYPAGTIKAPDGTAVIRDGQIVLPAVQLGFKAAKLPPANLPKKITLVAVGFETIDLMPHVKKRVVKDHIDRVYGGNCNKMTVSGEDGKILMKCIRERFEDIRDASTIPMILADAREMTDTAHDRQLRGHRGHHPQILQGVLQHPMLREMILDIVDELMLYSRDRGRRFAEHLAIAIACRAPGIGQSGAALYSHGS
jgi:hypothetical protein